MEVERAFEFFELTTDDPFDKIDRVTWDTCVHAKQDASTVDDTRLHTALHYKDIVMSVARYKRFHSDTDYNVRFAHMVAEQTPFQSLVLFLLQRCEELQYRRRDDACCKMLVRDGHPTFAYERICSIREFVTTQVSREMAPAHWTQLITSRENCDAIVRHLSEVEYIEFRKLRPDSGMISFANGIFSLRDNVFWPSHRREDFAALAEQVQLERRKDGWGAEYRLTPPTAQACTWHFVDRPFRPLTGVRRAVLDEMSDLLQQFGIAEPMQGWFNVLLGRLLFSVNVLDRWQVMPFFRTPEYMDHTVLMMFVSIFRAVLGDDSVAHLSSGVDIRHSLHILVRARINGLLMRESVPMEQGEWHKAVAGEPVCYSTSRKHPPYEYVWQNHLFGVGAQIPYKNDAGTVDRRVVMFEMSGVTAELCERFGTLVCDNMDIWLQSIVAAYLAAITDHAHSDLWTDGVMPDEFHRAREHLREMINPLYSCIVSTSFVRDSTSFMPLSEFKLMYQDYRQQRGLPVQRWVRDHWHAAFQDLALTIERSQREYRGHKQTCEWICGIDRKESYAPSIELPDITSEDLDRLSQERDRLDRELRQLDERILVATELATKEAELAKVQKEMAALRVRLQELVD